MEELLTEESPDEKLIDLHIHTVYSDGDHIPAEIVNLVKANNVSTFSITDHDTIDGVKKLLEDYNEPTIEFITGIELSSIIDNGRLHLLGYGFDPYNKNLNGMMEYFRENAIRRVKIMIDDMYTNFKIVFPDDDLEKLYNPIGNINRNDIAKLCVEYGYASNIDEAFEEYLRETYANVEGKIKEENLKIPPKEGIELINNAGGISVLAHYRTLRLGFEELDCYIKSLVNYGLQGIEAIHYLHNELYINNALALAYKYDLVVSGGSDFHGSVKPKVKLGSGLDGNVKIKDLSIMKKLRQR